MYVARQVLVMNKTRLEALDLGRSLIKNLTQCMGYLFYTNDCNPNGTCFVPAILDPNAPTQSPVTLQPFYPEPSASSAASGLPIVPVAAGAGGFVVLLIVFIVLRKRRNSPAVLGSINKNKSIKKTSISDRTVIAFENPMYADKNSVAGGGAGDLTDGLKPYIEGLYDDIPIFTAQSDKRESMGSKYNPLYNSQEDITKADAGGGYLDVDSMEKEEKEVIKRASYMDVSAPPNAGSQTPDFLAPYSIKKKIDVLSFIPVIYHDVIHTSDIMMLFICSDMFRK